jgi:hypothetical protein
MINLSAIPIWVIPTILAFIFGLGVAARNFATVSYVNDRIKECGASKVKESAPLHKDVESLILERKEIWDLVRRNDARSQVVQNDVAWIKRTLEEGRV